jgi:hypothetical protein
LSPVGVQRQDSLPGSAGLSAQILREHGALGVELLKILRTRIAQMLAQKPDLLIWTGFPNKEQRIAVAELALLVAHRRNEPTGVHTPRMIGWAWSQLQRISTLPKFLSWFARTWFTDDKTEGVDAAFQFMQACEFSFPRTLSTVEAIVSHLRPDAKPAYGPFIVALENWFRPTWMKELDETGIPLPLAERLVPHLHNPQSRSDALRQIAAIDLRRFPSFGAVDQFILSLVIP